MEGRTGPTSIFIAARVNHDVLALLLIAGAVLLILFGIWLITKRKGKDSRILLRGEYRNRQITILWRLAAVEKLTFGIQIIIGIILIIIANVLSFVLHNGIFSNISWVIYGLLFIINPVYPERYGNNEKKAKLGVRIARNHLHCSRIAYKICRVN